jgi:hypothetical protein
MLRVLARVPPCAMSLAVARSGLLAGSTIFVTNYVDTVRHENPISAGCSLVGRIRVAFDDGLSSSMVRRAARSTVPPVARLCHDSLPHSATLCGAVCAVPTSGSGLCAVPTSGAGLCAVPTSGAGLPSVPTADAGVSALPSARSGVRADLCTAKRQCDRNSNWLAQRARARAEISGSVRRPTPFKNVGAARSCDSRANGSSMGRLPARSTGYSGALAPVLLSAK